MKPFKATALATAVSAILATDVAPAQEVEEEVGDRQVEEIIVTGSRIKRRVKPSDKRPARRVRIKRWTSPPPQYSSIK